MKLHRLLIPLLVLSLASTNGFSQAAAGAGAGAAGAGAAAAGASGGLSSLAAPWAPSVGVSVGVPVYADAAGEGATNNNIPVSYAQDSTTTLVSADNTSVAAIFVKGGSSNTTLRTVASLAGTVSYTEPSTGKVITIDIGKGIRVDENGNRVGDTTIAELVAAEQANGTAGNADSVTSGLARIVSSVASVTASGQLGGNSSAVIASVLKVVAAANPTAAANYTSTLITAVAQSNLTPAQKQSTAAAAAEASLSAVPADQRAGQAEALQTVLTENATGLGLNATTIASTVTNATNATAPGTAGVTPPPSVTITQPVDTTLTVSQSTP